MSAAGYDPGGHAWRRVEGGNDLLYRYDGAGRLISVKTNEAPQKDLVDLVWASANGAGDLAKGTVKTARRHNWVGGVDNVVSETYRWEVAKPPRPVRRVPEPGTLLRFSSS